MATELVAYLSRRRSSDLDDAEFECPPLAPDIAIEIASPGDRPRRIAHKTGVYLAAGTALVVTVHPAARRERQVHRRATGGPRRTACV